MDVYVQAYMAKTKCSVTLCGGALRRTVAGLFNSDMFR
jgi:hypothetical protein